MSPTNNPTGHATLVTSPAPAPRPHEPACEPATPGDAPDNQGPPVSPLVPESMHRREDDAKAIATSPDFSERPDRATIDPPQKP